MRNTLMKYLVQQAEHDPTLYLIVGDVGFSVIEIFQEKFPQRYINAGVAEQAMLGVAAGLAMAGKNVYIYSIIPFVTMRIFEQIRNDLCYQQLPVKIIGVGGGFSYGPMGVTHHALEDVGIMRCLPEMTIVAPGSIYETAQLIPQINNCKGPAYVRLSTIEERVTYPAHAQIVLGKAYEVIAHPTQCIVTYGNALDLGLEVCNFLATQGISMGLVSMPTVKPLDETFFLSRNFDVIFTLEEHFIIGGLGEAIARMVCQKLTRKITFHAFGVEDFYFHEAGSRNFFKEKAGLSVQVIAQKIMEKLQGVHGSIHFSQSFAQAQDFEKHSPRTG